MKVTRQILKVGMVGVVCTFFTTGCIHDVSYEPAKSKNYSFSPALSPASSSEASRLDADAPSSSPAHYTSTTRVARERLKDPNVLGNLNLKTSDDARDEGVKFAIRKDYRSYTAETPIGESFNLGKHKVTPNFALGVHKDHKGMVGLVFRMPF